MSNVLYILFGLILTLGAYFLVTWGLTALYFFISHEKMNVWRDVKISATLAASALAITIVGMVAFSSLHIYIFATILTIVGFAGYMTLLKMLWKFNNFDAFVIATTLSIILNPAWLHLIGIV